MKPIGRFSQLWQGGFMKSLRSSDHVESALCNTAFVWRCNKNQVKKIAI